MHCSLLGKGNIHCLLLGFPATDTSAINPNPNSGGSKYPELSVVVIVRVPVL